MGRLEFNMSEVRDRMLKWVEGKVERGDAFIFPAGRLGRLMRSLTLAAILVSLRVSLIAVVLILRCPSGLRMRDER